MEPVFIVGGICVWEVVHFLLGATAGAVLAKQWPRIRAAIPHREKQLKLF